MNFKGVATTLLFAMTMVRGATGATPAFPRYDAPGAEEVHGNATGFFHTEKIHGRWWLIDPNGCGFYWVGTDHVNYHGHWCQKLGYAPYARVAQQKYGNEENWTAETLRRLRAWGFNTLTVGCSESLWHRGLPHAFALGMGMTFAGTNNLCPRTTWTGFPNVFSADWPRYCDEMARHRCAPNADDPWLLGYFFDNELEWLGKRWRPDGLFEEVWKKPANHSGKQAWLALLQQELGGIDQFNQAFGTTFTNFAALATDVLPRPAQNKTGEKLARTWARLIAEKYFATCTAAIHCHDPHHLLLGCRFAGVAPDIWDIAGKYCDVVSVNIYPRLDVDRGVPEKEFTKIRDWYQQADKPLAVTEWGFPGLDAGLPSRHGAGMRVDTQEQRAQCFAHYQDFLFRQPFIVGSSFFMYLDEPAEGISATFPEDSNYGLVSNTDEPYAPITAAAARVNTEVYQRHLAGGFQPVREAAPVMPAAWQNNLRRAAGGVPAQLHFSAGQLAFTLPRGRSVWRMTLAGQPMAELYPVLQQQSAGQDGWPHPQSARITAVSTNALATAVDIEFIFAGARSACVTMRYWIPQHGAWLASMGVSVENTATQTWQLGKLYHYCTPLTSGNPTNITPLVEVPDYYQPLFGWADRSQNRAVACWLPKDSRLQGYFWRDTSFHSDLHETAEIVLPPGAIWHATPTPVFWFAVPDASIAASAASARQIAAQLGFAPP